MQRASGRTKILSIFKVSVLFVGGALAAFSIHAINTLAYEGIVEDVVKYEFCCDFHGGCTPGPSSPCAKPQFDTSASGVATLISLPAVAGVLFILVASLGTLRRARASLLQLIALFLIGLSMGTFFSQISLRARSPHWLELARRLDASKEDIGRIGEGPSIENVPQ